MHSPRLAESYCDRMYEAELKQRGQEQKGLWGSYGDSTNYDMYLALIKVQLPKDRLRTPSFRQFWFRVIGVAIKCQAVL